MVPARRVRIVWSPVAIQRVESIALEIAGDRPAAAEMLEFFIESLVMNRPDRGM